uniref:BUD13 homolog n=1 Tax=Petromyzon marinus TaxID=7757 RepID=A0AAJ7XJ80_PETMA|nr:LOW QUALITY PROTEIN: BUD13 homolog [Petromyzon marinus]
MAAVSRAEYLKRYLSGAPEQPSKGKPRAKLKRKRGVENREGVRIIDDDVDWRIPVVADDDANKAAEEEEVPLVAEFVDERPLHLQRMEEFRTNSKWKLLGQDDSDENTTDENTRQRHDTDSDSDSGRAFKGAVIQKSPQNSNRHDSNSDSEHEPKTKNKLQHSKYNSDSDSDLSPVKRHRAKESGKSQKRTGKVGEDAGKGLNRAGSQQDSDLDMSPVNRRRAEESVKSLRRTGKVGEHRGKGWNPAESQQDSDLDMSPVNRRRAEESIKSMRRKGKVGEDAGKGSNRAESQQDSDSDMSLPDRNANGNLSPPRRMLKGGLVPVAIVRKERERERKEAAETNAWSSSASREASTVFRDRQGRVRDLQQEKLVKEQEAAEEQKRQEKYRTWGHGLAQVEAEQRSRDDDAHAASRPLARYRDDAELDAMLRAKMRDGDPMAKLLSRPDKSDKPEQAAKPRYSGPAPTANRYNIWPGHRWDGVDRSNGFETKRFTQISERKARNLEAHKWSVQDM